MDILGTTSLRDITRLRKFKRRRTSSYDPSGGNMDNFHIKPGEKRIIFESDGPGCINHIWSTQMCLGSKNWLRNVIIRMWWDMEENPSVECPLGDFFGMGHAQRENFISEPLQMSPEKGKGFNCWWPMPFRTHAKIEIENQDSNGYVPDVKNPLKRNMGLIFYYYVDYETYQKWDEDPENPIGYFHCQFNRIDYKKDVKHDFETGRKYKLLEWQMTGGKNTRENGGYDRNYPILHAKGKGHYVGCHLNIDNRWRWNYNWPGEGDDMIFIDEDIGKEPTLYGTGTEDYVNTAFCPQQKYTAPYHGVIKGGGFNWMGKITYYRYHIQDPIAFEKEIIVSIEHGHNNVRGDPWESTAYWYQLEPHTPFPKLPSIKDRAPRKSISFPPWLKKSFIFLLKITIFIGSVWGSLKVLELLKWI